MPIEMTEISIAEYSTLYQINEVEILQEIKSGQIKGRQSESGWVIELAKHMYEVDREEQPKLKAELKEMDEKVGCLGAIYMLINIASIGVFFWKKDKNDNSQLLLIPFLLTLPVWVQANFTEVKGKSKKWKISILRIINIYYKILAIIGIALGTVLGYLWVKEMIENMELKAIGVIIIILLIIIIYNQTRGKE